MTSRAGDEAVTEAMASAAAALGVTASVACTGRGFLRAALPVSCLAAASVSLVACTTADLARRLGHPADAHVDRALCDTWFGLHVRPVGGEAPAVWNPLSAAFQTGDGSWIRTHGNAPRHREAMLRVLGCPPDADAVAVAVRSWDAVALETAIIDAGGAAAALRSGDEWAASAPGRAVAAEPLIAVTDDGAWDGTTAWDPTPEAPLRGIRVLDLTRVIAGPACTQVLAGLGADVLRVDPPDWDEPAVLPLVMWNKRSARLDATTPAGARTLRELLAGADVLVHGYRAGALDRLGLDPAVRRAIRPGLIEVTERAYGWGGPWAARRGFDSVVQFACGIAHAGMAGAGAGRPVSLPVQALDWATGYLAAACAVAGLTRRADRRSGSTWRLSLARTALALQSLPVADDGLAASPPDVPTRRLSTAVGDVTLAASPLRVGAARLSFTRVATRLGGAAPVWR